MAITYYMLQIPSFWLFVLLVSFGATFTGSATYLFNKYIRVKVLRSHNEVTGFVFLAVASFYALLLSFSVLVVWEQLNETYSNVSKEGSSAMGLYRGIKYYPDTVESKELLTVYLDFVYNVIDDEFPKMREMKPSYKTSEALNHVFYKMEHLNPKNPFQIQLVSEMFSQLNELTIYRGLRTSSIDSEIPAPMWFPIIFGAIVTLLCSLLLDVEHTRVQLWLNSLLGIFFGILLFIIILLDHPFTGPLAIKPKGYKEIFTMEKWTKDYKSIQNKQPQIHYTK